MNELLQKGVTDYNNLVYLKSYILRLYLFYSLFLYLH